MSHQTTFIYANFIRNCVSQVKTRYFFLRRTLISTEYLTGMAHQSTTNPASLQYIYGDHSRVDLVQCFYPNINPANPLHSLSSLPFASFKRVLQNSFQNVSHNGSLKAH